MKTRVIQNEPGDPASARSSSAPPEAEPHSTEQAGWIGRWSPRQRRIAIWAALAAVVLGAAYLVTRPGFDTPAANGAGAGPEFAAIERFVRKEMAAQRIPGLALGIVKGDRIAYLRGFGKADESGRAVTPQTPFILGSVSKSFTALAIMQLVEAGKIELDAPVQRYLPWFRVADEEASAQITVRHLLNQTSGLSTKTGRSFNGSGDTSDAALETAVRKLRSAEPTAPVGEKHQYSTINYSVLGLIVQTVTGRSYESYVEAAIFNEIEQGRSPFLDAAHGVRRTFARVLGKLVDEFLPAARVFILKLHARRSERIGLRCLRHAGLLELPCRRLRFRCELLTLVGRGPIAAARHHQRTRALRIGEAEVECREAADGKSDDMSFVDFQRVEHGTNVVARTILRITLSIRRHVRGRITPRVVGDAPIAAGKIANLRFPRAIVAGEFMHEDD